MYMVNLMQNLFLILPFLVAANVMLTGVKLGLEKVKDITASKLDDTAFAFVTKIVDFLSKVIDIFSANPKH